MNRLLLAITTIAAFLFLSLPAAAQTTITYDFDSGPGLAALYQASGTVEAVPLAGITDNGTPNSTNLLRPKTVGSPNATGVADFTAFSSSTDYSVTWKEYITQSATSTYKKGFLLRGTGTGGYTTGIKRGYYFMVQNNSTTGSVNFRILNASAGTSLTDLKNSGTLTIPGFAVNKACWFRASVKGNVLTFEYSTDGVTFTVGTTYTDAANLYPGAGSTQLVYGIGSPVGNFYYDDVQFKELGFIHITGPSTYLYSGAEQGPATYTSSGGAAPVFTYSGTGNTVYGPSAAKPAAVGTYKAVASSGNLTSPDFHFTIVPKSAKVYDFSSDAAGAAPANITTQSPNTAATVVRVSNITNALHSSSAGSTNIGVANLDLFPSATNYSVTWQELPGVTGSKKAFLLRANGSPNELTTEGVTNQLAGAKKGYLFFVQGGTPSVAGQLRIYVYKGETALSGPKVTANINFIESCWYRATVNGPILSLEYSADGIHFTPGITYSDVNNTYPAGGTTQFLWGFNAPVNYLDNIGYNPLSVISYTGPTTFIYDGAPHGPDGATVSGSAGAVTYTYSGTGATVYPASSVKPSALGTYQVVISVAADGAYAAVSKTIPFAIKNASTIQVTGSASYLYNNYGQGPSTATVTGSIGTITYRYSGTGATVYGPTHIPPSKAGTYQAIATVAGDAQYGGATSAPFAFSIVENPAIPAVPFRRTLSPATPMLLVHIDAWAHQPQDVLDKIPADIKPFVVLNVSLSTSVLKEEGVHCADSWLNTCAQNGVWAMVQVSSGILNSFLSDTAFGVYESLYQRYPNFIGYNFAEQSWGYDNNTFQERLNLFVRLLQMGRKYGGYLYVNDCFSVSNAAFNSVAKFKASQYFADSTIAYKENFIFGDKFTNSWAFYDNESGALGAFLSGHAGNYAIRYDMYSWPWSGKGKVFGTEIPDDRNEDGNRALFSTPEAVMGVPIVEHMMLTGATVIDGPEVPWMSTISPKDSLPSFTNMIADVFRKVLDGTIRIPTVNEVIARTKIALVNDVDVNTPDSLFSGLYAMDGVLKKNRTWFKKSGRYPSIPQLALSDAYETSPFLMTVKKSEYALRWPTEQAKIDEFNSLFPEQSTGNMNVSRINNSLFCYNPWINTDTVSTARVPLQYNTCDSIALSYPAHTFSVINESGNKLQVYLNNYRTDKSWLYTQYPNDFSWFAMQNTMLPAFAANPTDATFRNSVIKVYGSSGEPTFTLADRGKHKASIVATSWQDGVFTITVSHNGPVDLTINCSGNASGRMTVPENVVLTPAAAPPVYTGYKMYEAEGGVLAAPASKVTSFPHYHGTGYVRFAANFTSGSGVTFKVINVQEAGTYELRARYSTPATQTAAINKVDLYVNGVKLGTPAFPVTGHDSVWAYYTQNISLNAGANTIMYKANSLPVFFNIDNIKISTLEKMPSRIKLEDGSFTYNGQPQAASGFAYGTGGEADRLNPGLSFTYKDSAGQVLSGQPVAAGTYQVVASFAGNFNYLPAADTASMTINRRALTITAADQVKECGSVLDPGTTAFTTEGLVAGDAVNSVTLYSDGAAATGSTGTYALVAADAQGSGLSNYTISYVAGTLLVQDRTKPVPQLAELPRINGECSATVAAAPTATDGCAGILTATTTDPLTYTEQGSYTITWTFDDGQGNTAIQTQTVVVNDATAPVITSLPVVPVQCFQAGGNYAIPALVASDNCGSVTISYTISGATTRSGNGANASGSFNVGTSNINWTISDGHGNATSAQTTVTVNRPVTASIPDVYAVSTTLDAPNTLYYGYGPSSLTLTAEAGGGTGAWSYSWNGGQPTGSPALSVSAGGTYSVTVSDAHNCTATASLVIKTLDVRCGNDNSKVKVCHNGKDICIASASVEEHLAHGDRLGGCNDVPSMAAPKESSEVTAASTVRIYPNPVSDNLRVQLVTVAPGATVQLYDAAGVQVLSMRLTAPVQNMSVTGLPSGMYYVLVRNGDQVILEKVIKQ